VNAVHTWRAPWIESEPEPVSSGDVLGMVDLLRDLGCDEAIILTSFHQSPLPFALLCKLAGIQSVGATSEDYPGTLLDVRHRVPDDIHEVERSLSLVAAMGYRLPEGDDGALRILRRAPHSSRVPWKHYVVVHPGASVPARAWPASRNAALVDSLVEEGYRVVVTGGPNERQLTRTVAGEARPSVMNLGGRLDFSELAEVLAAASALVVGNTGPAHLASALGVPVVSLYAPTVPAARWHPWRVPHVILGDQGIPCAS
jgi:ADP-heptose:LPS heptosyltransferase